MKNVFPPIVFRSLHVGAGTNGKKTCVPVDALCVSATCKSLLCIQTEQAEQGAVLCGQFLFLRDILFGGKAFRAAIQRSKVPSARVRV